MATPIITAIETEMKTLIEGMSISGGYELDWAPINYEDRALEDHATYDVFCTVNWLREVNQDEPEGLHFQAYHNIAEYSIEVRCPLTTESTNPLFDARPMLQLALSDLKKLFGTYPSLNANHAFKTMYRSAEILDRGQIAGDRFTPYYLSVVFHSWYFQDRQDVYTTCM